MPLMVSCFHRATSVWCMRCLASCSPALWHPGSLSAHRGWNASADSLGKWTKQRRGDGSPRHEGLDPQRFDLPGSGAHAFHCARCAQPPRAEHTGKLGQDGRRRGRCLSGSRGERPWRGADGRIDNPRCGRVHGQLFDRADMARVGASVGRPLRERTTKYTPCRRGRICGLRLRGTGEDLNVACRYADTPRAAMKRI